jgi:hypothetical protein
VERPPHQAAARQGKKGKREKQKHYGDNKVSAPVGGKKRADQRN